MLLADGVLRVSPAFAMCFVQTVLLLRTLTSVTISETPFYGNLDLISETTLLATDP